jgi:hypothetical protein
LAWALTANLNQKRQDVAAYEDFGNPCCPDDGVVLRVNETDNSTEDHINGRCVDGGGHEDENGLHEERNQRVVWLLLDRDVPEYVSDKLDCGINGPLAGGPGSPWCRF